MTGLSSSATGDDEGAGGYLGQIAEAKARLAAAGTEAEQAKVKIGLAEREIKEKEPRAKKASKEGEGALKDLETKKTDVEKIRKRVQAAGWDEGKERRLAENQAEHSQQMQALMEVSLKSKPLLRSATGHAQITTGCGGLHVFRPLP